MDVRHALVGAEGRRGGQKQLLLDDAGLGMVLGELQQPLLQSAPQQVQALGGLTQTRLSLRDMYNSGYMCNLNAQNRTLLKQINFNFQVNWNRNALSPTASTMIGFRAYEVLHVITSSAIQIFSVIAD